jgi:2-polyprenyl-3-methyl-5-hydroxy-6-metoxy-1,4-benzoquinol methylase
MITGMGSTGGAMEREPAGAVRARTAAHYATLADHYDTNWTHSETFLAWMASEIITVLELVPTDRLADVGCGTGLFTRRIAASGRVRRPVVCVDPSAEMLAQIPAGPELAPVEASAERLAGLDNGPLPGPASRPFDAILVKEAIHHVAPDDRPGVLAGLAGWPPPAGSWW